MTARLSDRHAAIVALCPDVRPIIDVGADHGYVAAALGAIAVERLPHRRGPADVRWVIADGLRPFRAVGTAIICGMGADRIAAILAEAVRPQVIVVHAADDPDRLRVHLVHQGWRIDAERLAVEGTGFAEILRAVPGVESSTGARLRLGPRLLDGRDPLFLAWQARAIAVREGRLAIIAGHEPARTAAIEQELAVLRSAEAHLATDQES